MLAFKSFSNARRVLVGIEFVQKILKGQYRVPTRGGSQPRLTLADCSQLMNCTCALLQENPQTRLKDRLKPNVTACLSRSDDRNEDLACQLGGERKDGLILDLKRAEGP